MFAPGNTMTDQYFAFVDALQYVFIRNYQRGEIIKRISLSLFPTCISLTSFQGIKLDEMASISELGIKQKGTFLLTIGTKEGKILVYRVGTLSQNSLYQTKNGVSYGAITSIDVSTNMDHMFAGTESGELMIYDLKAKLNEP